MKRFAKKDVFVDFKTARNQKDPTLSAYRENSHKNKYIRGTFPPVLRI